ncbi:MAG: rhodanese-like domain-containing protein [Anaerolineae bacterium]
MFVRQFVDEGLGNSSYLVASEEAGLAVAIDPQRDVDRYVQVAEGLGLRLTHALDTHLHADFVSGARELAAQAGIRIGASAQAELAFDHLPLREGDTIPLGDVTIEVLTTPGHTPEHISFAMRPAAPQTHGGAGAESPAALFSGGALIVGGAARTDLLGHDLTKPLARHLYHTIHHKLLRFPDDASVYPTHGAGSFCAAPDISERTTTIGLERQRNPLVQASSEEAFMHLALEGLPSYPTYYQYMRPVNQRGPQVLGGLPLLEPLSPASVRQQMEHGVAVIDTRTPHEFAAGHIPGAYGIPLAAPLVTWAGWVVPFGSPIILVADTPADREDAVRQLIRIGYDDLRGYLEGGVAAWEAAGPSAGLRTGLPVARVPLMTADELRRQLAQTGDLTVLDVRQDAEWVAGHIPQAIHIEAGRLPKESLSLPVDSPVLVHCGHADRSTVSISVLEQRGYRNLMLLDGGFNAWETAGYEIRQ